MNNDKRFDASAHEGRALPLCHRGASSCQASGIGRWLARAALLLWILTSLNVFAASEDTFATLRVGDRTYQNVKVTTKGKNFIIISHSAGITSIKVSELPLEILEKLGYVTPKPKKHIKEGPMWAGVAVPKAEAVLIKPARAKLSQAWSATVQAWDNTRLASKFRLVKRDRGLAIIVAATLLAVYLFYSYCCMLICQKTGNNPGFWVFVPVVQVFPLLRAASMSPGWFVALLIPGVNLAAYIVWCLKIVDARHKTLPLAILLIFPLTSWFAFLFLAFSQGIDSGKEEFSVEIMSPQSVLTTTEAKA